MYKRGGYKIPAAWGLKIYTPTPLAWKMPFAQKWGEGGGGLYNFSLEHLDWGQQNLADFCGERGKNRRRT